MNGLMTAGLSQVARRLNEGVQLPHATCGCWRSHSEQRDLLSKPVRYQTRDHARDIHRGCDPVPRTGSIFDRCPVIRTTRDHNPRRFSSPEILIDIFPRTILQSSSLLIERTTSREKKILLRRVSLECLPKSLVCDTGLPTLNMCCSLPISASHALC
jgi:hypothetical protein